MRKPLPAVPGRAGDSDPTAFDVSLVGLFETFGGEDRAVGQPLATLLVAGQVEGLQHFFGELPALAQDRLDDVDRGFREAR
jgi:hypothetical protein